MVQPHGPAFALPVFPRPAVEKRYLLDILDRLCDVPHYSTFFAPVNPAFPDLRGLRPGSSKTATPSEWLFDRFFGYQSAV